MKKTKTIEVEICDQCGDEITRYHLRNCSSCNKEMCQNCEAHINVEIRASIPRPYTVGVGLHGTRVRPIGVEYQDAGLANVYCTVCGNGIVDKLKAAGLAVLPTEERESSGTFDRD